MLHPSHKLRSSRTASLLVCFFFAAGGYFVFNSTAQTSAREAQARERAAPINGGLESIRLEELRQKLTVIASEKFKGRGNGTPELNMTAEYIAGVFEKNGLKPVNARDGFFQTFDMYTARLGQANDVRIGGVEPTEWKLKLRADFIPAQWSVGGSATGRLVYVETPEATSVDVRGKIAVIMEGRGPVEDPEFPENAAAARKMEAEGAVGVIVAEDPVERSPGRIMAIAENFRDDLPTRMTTMGVVDSPDFPHVPVVIISSDVARELFPAFKNGQTGIEATITTDVERKTFKTQNVIGLIEGVNANLKSEFLIVGAHYDHDGESNGQIWYGADDDGSGTAALLELAEAFGNGSAKPARSILLCAWVGEEKGLLGSRYYASHPLFPLKQTVSAFQMDMIGRNEDHAEDRGQGIPEERASDNSNTLNVLGTAFSPDLKSIISRENDHAGLSIHFRYDFKAQDLLRRSDQWSFLSKGIPAVFFFTGLHPDYHTPRDTAGKINYPKLEKITKLVYLAALDIANRPARPRYVNPPVTTAGQR